MSVPGHCLSFYFTIMHYTEHVVHMQKHFLNNNILIQDAIRKHQKEAILPKLKSLYHKTSGINPENKC